MSVPDRNDDWREETVFNDGDSFFERFCASIEGAQTRVDLETYIFDLDVLGLRILDLLAKAVRRGVKVRLLIDGVGGSQWTRELADHYRELGIHIRFFHPLPWQKPSRKFWQSIGIRSLIFGLHKLRRRNHRKLFIVDEQTAFVGSMNVSARHLASAFPGHSWRDTGVCITGPGVNALFEAFQSTWNESDPPLGQRKKLERFFRRLHPRVILNFTFFQRKYFHEALIREIGRARSRIWIANPYLIPDQRLLRQLIRSAQTIDVRLLVPKVNDFFGVQYAMESRYAALLKGGARIYAYLPSMMHAKIVIIDDLVSIGSSNLDHLSLFQNYEADVVLTHPENRALVQRQFLDDLAVSEELTFESWKHRSIPQKLMERLFYLFRGFL